MNVVGTLIKPRDTYTYDSHTYDTRQHMAELCAWFGESKVAFKDFALEAGITVAKADAAIAQLETNLRRCRAETRDRFVLWAAKQITKHSDYRGSLAAIQKLDLDVLELFNRAEQQYEFKPMNTETTSSTMFVDLGKVGGEHRIWKVPTDQSIVIRRLQHSWAQVAEKLWPCHLRKVGTHYQVTKKISGQPVHVARILIGARDDEMVKFADGDSLNYTGDNVYIVSDRRGPTAQEEQDKFEDSICKYGTNTNLDNATHDPTVAKAKRPKGAGTTDVDAEKIGRELRSGDYRGSGGKITAITPKRDFDSEGEVFEETLAHDLAPGVKTIEKFKSLGRDSAELQNM